MRHRQLGVHDPLRRQRDPGPYTPPPPTILTLATRAPLESTFKNLTAVTRDPAGGVAVSGNADGVHTYLVSDRTTGALKVVGSQPTTGTPMALATATGPDGAEVLIVVTNASGVGNVASFLIDPSSGLLTPVTTTQVGNGEPGTTLALTSLNGTSVAYAGGRSTVSRFSHPGNPESDLA